MIMATTSYSKIPFILVAIFFLIIQRALAFDIAGLQIGDTVDDFEKIQAPAKEYLTITHDPKGKIVRILYRQRDLPNDKKTQIKLINSICNKYGHVISCSSALADIESDDEKQFLRFFHLYRNEQETEELRARIKRTKLFSLTPNLTVEIDLMKSAYAKALKKQRETASDLIDF